MFTNPFYNDTPSRSTSREAAIVHLSSHTNSNELSSLKLPEPSLQSPLDSEGVSPRTSISVIDFAYTPKIKDSAAETAPTTPSDTRPNIERTSSSLSLWKKTYSYKLRRHNVHQLDASSANGKGKEKTSLCGLESVCSSSSSSIIHSPDVQAMVKHEVVPDLNAVNTALEAISNGVSNSSDSEEERQECVRELTTIANSLTIAHKDAKKILVAAMDARGHGKVEVCRGLCWEIIRNPLAEAVTKIYAYNILATQASPGNQQHFLKYSTELVHQEVKDVAQKGKLLGAIALLRESNREKCQVQKKKTAEKDAMVAETKSTNAWHEHGNAEWRRQVAEKSARSSAASSPELKPIADGIRTPKTEKILQWANGDLKGVRTAEEILCSCYQDRGRARKCLVHD